MSILRDGNGIVFSQCIRLSLVIRWWVSLIILLNTVFKYRWFVLKVKHNVLTLFEYIIHVSIKYFYSVL